MNEETPALLYRNIPGSRTVGLETVVSALRFEGSEPIQLDTDRAAWSSRACALLGELLKEGRASGTDLGNSLPFASLRAAISAAVPTAILLERDLGAPWGEKPRLFLETPVSGAPPAESLGDSLNLWVALSLRPWAADVGAPENLVDALQELGSEAFTITKRVGELGDVLKSGAPFPEKRDAILQRAALALEGKELFEGLGPVWRIVRAHGASNELELLTWPSLVGDALQSMVAKLTVETIPFSPEPIVTVRASRRRWLTEVPSGGSLFGQRSVTVSLLSRERPNVALEVGAPVRNREVQDPIAPEYLGQLFRIGADLAAPLGEMVQKGARGPIFVGVPYSPQLGGSHPLGAGVSTRDQLDLFDEVRSHLEDDGFSPIPFEETPTLRRAPKRPKEHHKALEAEILLSDIALSIGRNDLDDDASIEAAWNSLGIEGDSPPAKGSVAAAARRKIEELREANIARIASAFGARRPKVVVLSRTEAERSVLATILRSLFGTSIEVEPRPLPADVHGARADLPAANGKPKERFEARINAWRPLAETLRRIDCGSHVLVEAADWYNRKPDDRVNKLAGRFALASGANANVQYLRPKEGGQRGFANYLHRVQAAIYDLVFGHSGLVSDVSGVVAGAFPSEDTRPTSIVGISVLTQARTRVGGRAGRLCLATRIDCATSQTSAKVGWFDGEMRWTTDWEPLFSALKRIASPEINTTLGQGIAAERTNYQLFVGGVLDACAEDGDRPFVLLDSTSAAGLWPWLTDSKIGGEITLGAERLEVSRRWPGARLVRIRTGQAPRISERKWALYQEVDEATGEDVGDEVRRYCPTIIAETVKISRTSAAAHYLTTAGYFQMTLPRGLSVYRKLASFVPLAKLRKDAQLPPGHKRLFAPLEIAIPEVSYRLPNPIETTVALAQKGDDPDLIAHLVASLREGYGHTAASTTLPAPLSFESKARDYMTRFGLDAADDEDAEEEREGERPLDAPTSPGEPAGLENDGAGATIFAEPALSAINPLAWRNLVERKGISFMDSTSLSTSNLSTDEQGGLGLVPPAPTPPVEAPAQGDHDEKEDGNRSEPTSRRPVMSVPDFVTSDYLRQWTNVTNAHLRAMHDARHDIARISGFTGWPETRPTVEQFLALLPGALRYPRFLAVVTQAAKAKISPSKAERWDVFGPIWKRGYSEAKMVRDSTGSRFVSLKEARPILDMLIKGDKSDIAILYIFTVGYAYELPSDVHELVDGDPLFAGLREFMASVRRELFHTDYSWEGNLRSWRNAEAEASGEESAELQFDDGGAPNGVETREPTATPPAEVTPTPERPLTAETPSEPAMLENAPMEPEEVPTAVDPESAWFEAMSEIASAASASATPTAEALASIALRLREAEEALKAYEAARPRLVDASASALAVTRLFERIRMILLEAGQADEISPGEDVPSTPMLPPATVAQMEEELARIDDLVDGARERLNEALDIMRNLVVARLEEAVSLRTDAVATAREAARRVFSVTLLMVRPPESTPTAAESDPFDAEVPLEHQDEQAQVETPKRGLPDSKRSEAMDRPATELAVPVIEDAASPDSGFGPLDGDHYEWDAEDDVEDEHVEDKNAPIEAASETARKSPSEWAPADEPLADPLNAQIRENALGLVERRRFGLAYHLQLAATSGGLGSEFGYTQSELRLAAIAGHVNHAALQGSELLHDLLANVKTSMDAIDEDEPLGDARRILALGYIAPIALYHSDSEGRLALDALRHVADGLGDAAHAFREAIAAPFGLGFNLSPAMMRLAAEEAEEDRYVRELTHRLLTELDEFAERSYKFQLGMKLRNVLSRTDGEMGRLRDRIAKGGAPAVEAARDFSERFAERNAILHLLEDAEKRTNNSKYTGIDGIARDRMVGFIQSLAAICAEYVEASTAAPALRGTKQNIQKVRSGIVNATGALIAALKELEPADNLSRSAIDFTTGALEVFLSSVRGDATVPSPNDHLYALHGPLLWIPALDFGHSWLPAPYAVDQIVGSILDLPPRDGPSHSVEELAATLTNRFTSGAHIAAAMLIEAAAFYGMSVEQAQQLSELRQADTQTRRDALTVELRDARLMVDRLQRMGGGAGQDEVQSLLSLLDRIVPDELPVIISAEARTEAQEGQQILDFKAGFDLIRDVRARISSLLQRPRDELLRRIDRISGSAAPDDLEVVRGLVGRDDLLTATEYVEFLENGRALPETTSPNPRFQAFFPAVPELLTAMSREEREQIGDRIVDGIDVGPLLFSRVSTDRRPEAADVHERWRELKRAVAAAMPEPDVASRLALLLSSFGINAEIRSSGARGNRRLYTSDFRFKLPVNSDSVLLPDFGSLTGGDYRICVASKLPTEAEFSILRKDAGALRLIVFLTEAVTAERRRQLHTTNIEKGFRLLVIDDAIMLFALSEPELRGQTLFECAQPFSFAEPYRDYGNAAVPPEMFFGRSSEQRKLLEPHGSCIVYGGRRLGKTALLKHIKSEFHDPQAGTVIAYVSILDLGANESEDQIWESMSRELDAVFQNPADTCDRFTEEVRRWLNVDSKRRILVLLDESDRFIQADANKGFAQFVRMQRLMDDTNRRFKFVLAGLHNVTRLVHTENPPLKQIASDPQRIGPLMDEELGDAEALVVKPLAGMGFEFDNREDVWRILSHCNYYPVLVQKFCQQLVQQLNSEIVRRHRPVNRITSEHIRQALDNPDIAREIGETFDYTISKIEDRYALIANIVADRATRDAANGRIGEGMSSVEVRDAAASWWPAAFREANRLAIVEDLLDEMEGLGVLRRTPGGRWALRSPTILRMLGGDDKIAAKLGEFMDRDAPPVFDPRSMRRTLKSNAPMKISKGDVSPLTWGQEHDLLRDRTPVTIVFGNQLSSIQLVSGSLASIGNGPDGRRPVDVKARNWPTLEALLKELRTVPGERPALHVVDQSSSWDAKWVAEAAQIRQVKEARTRVLFVGGPEQAVGWTCDPLAAQISETVKIIPLQTWSSTLIDHRLQQEHLDPDQCRPALRRSTGGFNLPMQDAFASASGTQKAFLNKLDQGLARRRADPALAAELGLVGDMYDLFVRIAEYAGGNDITAYEIEEGPINDLGLAISGLRAVEFGVLMAILEGQAGAIRNEDDSRPYKLNPLLLATLTDGKAR